MSSKSTSKNSSENLSNQNKLFWWYWKTSSFWHFNSSFVLKTAKSEVFVCRPICLLYYWDFLTNFLTCFLMTTIWRPLFDAIQNSIFRHLKNIFQTILYQNVHCGKRLFPVNDESATLSIFSLDLHLRHDSRTNNLGYCGLCVDISLILEFWTKIFSWIDLQGLKAWSS